MVRVEKIRVEDESKKTCRTKAKLLEEKAELERLVKLAETTKAEKRSLKRKSRFSAKQAEVARQLGT
jgi:hypothetical protein